MSAFAIHRQSRIDAPQLSASQNANLPISGSGPVTATLLTHDALAAAGRTINFNLLSGGGSLTTNSGISNGGGETAVTYTAPNQVTIGIVGSTYTPVSGATLEALTAVYVGYRANVTDLYVGRVTGSASVGGVLNVTKTGSANPLLVLARFDGNPQSSQPDGSESSPFVDIHLPDDTNVDSLVVQITCSGSCGSVVWWGNPVTGVWQEVSNAGLSISGSTASFTLNGGSTPSLAQLDGTPFVVSNDQPTVVTLTSFTIRPESETAVPLLITTLLLTLGVAGAVAARRRR
jgi:hypothetical protein